MTELTAAFCGNEVFLQVKNCESIFFLFCSKINTENFPKDYPFLLSIICLLNHALFTWLIQFVKLFPYLAYLSAELTKGFEEQL